MPKTDEIESKDTEDLPTYGPLVVRYLLVLDLLLNAFSFPNLPSIFLLAAMAVLFFLPIGRGTFKFISYVMQPLILIYFVYFYVINIAGVVSPELFEKYPWAFAKFNEPTLNIFLIFSAFFFSSWLVRYGTKFEQTHYIFYLDQVRDNFKAGKRAGVLANLNFYLLHAFGFLIMIGVLVSACLNVTLFNVILIYLSLFYMSMREDSVVMFNIMLAWSTTFFLLDYTLSQFNLKEKGDADLKLASTYLDLKHENNYSFYEIDQFSLDKVLIVLGLWTRLQLHRLLSKVSSADQDLINLRLKIKSPFLNFLIKSTFIIEKIIFVGVLAGMIGVLMFTSVNIVNWLLLILLLILLCLKFAVKVEDEKQDQKGLRIFATAITLYCALMIILQTCF